VPGVLTRLRLSPSRCRGPETFAPARGLLRQRVRAREAVTPPTASSRHARSVARTLDRLARAAESGARQSRRTRPPYSVVEMEAEATAIRDLARLVRMHPEPPAGVVTACDRFADGCWNGAMRRLDREFHRRELGRLRFLLLSDSGH
jgi:hypothetical protein